MSRPPGTEQTDRVTIMTVSATRDRERCFSIMERGRPARKKNHESGGTPRSNVLSR
jgi:hypothetical protein